MDTNLKLLFFPNVLANAAATMNKILMGNTLLAAEVFEFRAWFTVDKFFQMRENSWA